MMKAQFMSLWDGLDTDYNCQVSAEGDEKSNESFLSWLLCIEPFGKSSRLHVATIAYRVSVPSVIARILWE